MASRPFPPVTTDDSSPPATPPATGGESGAVGYEYQIKVTVWLALEWMLRRRWCPSIEVEPVSQEDLAARLDVPPDQADLHLRLGTGPVEMDVQIKSRSTGQWTAPNFRNVVSPTEKLPEAPSEEQPGQQNRALPANPPAGKKKGPPPRPRPLERLQDHPERRYLFVTNADVDESLRPFVVGEAGVLSKAREKPWTTEPELPGDLAVRIGICPQINFAFLDLSIRQLLGEHGHVPGQRRTACLKDLVEDIRDRLLQRADKAFTFADLRAVIRRHKGLPPEREPTARPMNFGQMQQRLDQMGALLLAGPPGTGKTTVAEELAYLLRRGEDAFEIIHGADDPAQIRQRWTEEGRFLFLVDDPWGAYQVGVNAARWWKELPALFAGLRQHPGTRIIVTTRTGIYAAVRIGKIPPALKSATIHLQSGDYTRAQRRDILHRALADSQPWQREWLGRHEDKILDALEEPMALHSAGRAIVQETRKNRLDVDELIKTCAQDALGSQFAQEVAGRGEDEVRAALALWAWQRLHGGMKENAVGDLLGVLRAGGADPPPDVQRFLRWAESSEWWPRREGEWRVHPTLMKGLDDLAEAEPGAANGVLRALIAGLLEAGRMPEALRLRLEVRKRLSDPDAKSEARLAAYVFDRFVHGPEAEANRAYYDARHFAHVAHPVAELLKLLEPKEHDPMGRKWSPPAIEKRVLAELSASTDARMAAWRFIRFVVARDHDVPYKGRDLAEFLRCFGWDFSRECLELALKELAGRPDYSCVIVVELALSGDAPDYYAVFDAALDALAEMATDDKEDEQTRKAKQWEASPAGLEQWYESRGEDYHRLEKPLKAAIEQCRDRGGWLRLAVYPRMRELLPFWMEVLERNGESSEFGEVMSLCEAKHRGDLWKAAARCGRTELVGVMLEALPNMPPDEMQECVDALIVLIEPAERPAVLVPALRALPWERRAGLNFRRSPRRGVEERSWWEDCFTEDEETARWCCGAKWEDKEESATVSAGARERLVTLAERGEIGLATRALSALTKLGHPAPLAAARLWRSSDGMARRQALLAAVGTRLPDAEEWLQTALDDPEARVRESALRELALRDDPSVRGRLLALSNDRSALVRKALAEVIGERSWREGVPVLLHLLRDEIDFADYDDPESYYHFNVARAAAASLGRLRPLAPSTIDAVLAFLAERPTRDSKRHDHEVHRRLFQSLAGEADARILPWLIRALADGWNVNEWRTPYFPLRAAAAWAIYEHLRARPEEMPAVPSAVIGAAANDFDPYLARPALIVLGMLGTLAADEFPKLRASASYTPERCLLVWLAFPSEAEAERKVLRAAVGIDHPCWALLQLPDAPDTEEDWREFFARNRAFAEWFRSLRSDEDVRPTLRRLLRGELSAKTMRTLVDEALKDEPSAVF